jgi:hypothetical protein
MSPHNLQIYLYNVDNNTLSPLLYNDTNLDNDWESLSLNIDNYDDSFNYKILFFIHQDDESFSDVAFDDIVYQIDDNPLVAFVSETSSFTFVLQGSQTTPDLSVLSNQETAFVRVVTGADGGKVNISDTPKTSGLTVYNGGYIYFEGSQAFTNDVYLLSDVIPARIAPDPTPEPTPDPTPNPNPDPNDNTDEPVDKPDIIMTNGSWTGKTYRYVNTDGDFIFYTYLHNGGFLHDRAIKWSMTTNKWTDGHEGDTLPNVVIHEGDTVTIKRDSEILGVFTDPFHPEPPITSSGGTVSYADGYTIHTFTSSGDFLISQNVNVEYLVIAGGGGGGYGHYAGGGGAGSFMEGLGFNTGGGSVVIGGGGSGGNANNQQGSNGSNSSFSTIIANGGGGAGSRANVNGKNGGSGGGGSTENGAMGLTNQSVGGNDGGNGRQTGGGGGGAGGIGQIGGSNSNADGRNGGDGKSSGISGTEQVYSAGGGGGAKLVLSSSASGIGGRGGRHSPMIPPTSGMVNTGSGGGGHGTDAPGASGGSGIVIIRYVSNVSPN